jgi:hypothetical protein
VALGLALAMLELPPLVAEACARLRGTGEAGSTARRLSTGVTFALVALGLPWTRTAAAYAGEVDPRHAVARWLATHVDQGTVVLDHRVGLDPRTLVSSAPLLELELDEHPGTIAELAGREGKLVAVVPKKDAARTLASVPEAHVVAEFSTAERRGPGRPAFRELTIVAVP